MSTAQRINDHSSWIGRSSADSVLPMGTKHKSESSANGAGHLSHYEDKTEDIKASQVKAKQKVAAHASKPMFRN